MSEAVILGGGVTGLAAGIATGAPVYEAEAVGGGICSSYYMRPGEQSRLHQAPADGETYRFEIGGGHWIFGGAPAIIDFIMGRTPLAAYERRASVFLPDERLYVPYPLQNHLDLLGADRANAACAEIESTPAGKPETMEAWLRQSFGDTLTALFFGPFHEAYTAGLWTRIAPQDAYKSPVTKAASEQAASTRRVGYNHTFLYPSDGLDALVRSMAADCDITYDKRAVAIDPKRKEISFSDGTGARYERLHSTLPLDRMMAISGLSVEAARDPYSSVLVINLGAVRGPQCPDTHWIYVPRSEAGFHRVGFYSNVEPGFLPRSRRDGGTHTSLYVERAYPGGEKPTDTEIASYAERVQAELTAWGFINGVECLDPTWIDVAYTWSWPGSSWRGDAMRRLEEYDIMPVGRYARWVFQGIAESIEGGLGVML